MSGTPKAAMMRIIDLSHVFDAAVPVYPGDPAPTFRQFSDVSTGGCELTEVTTVLHAATHIDSPRHMLQEGAGIAEIPVERFLGRGVLIDARDRAVIDADLLNGRAMQQGDIVLLMSGKSKRYRMPDYFTDTPEVTTLFARALIEAGVGMLGIDFPSPDRPPYPVHRLLLENRVLIMENLTNLEALLEAERFEVIALPVRFAAEAAPARVIARIALLKS